MKIARRSSLDRGSRHYTRASPPAHDEPQQIACREAKSSHRQCCRRHTTHGTGCVIAAARRQTLSLGRIVMGFEGRPAHHRARRPAPGTCMLHRPAAGSSSGAHRRRRAAARTPLRARRPRCCGRPPRETGNSAVRSARRCRRGAIPRGTPPPLGMSCVRGQMLLHVNLPRNRQRAFVRCWFYIRGGEAEKRCQLYDVRINHVTYRCRASIAARLRSRSQTLPWRIVRSRHHRPA